MSHKCVPDAEVIRKSLKMLGTKWSILIIRELLMNGTCRYGELKSNLEGISTKTLTLKLRTLETENIIERKVYAQTPPKVEYSLTKQGKDLKNVLQGMKNWYEKWH